LEHINIFLSILFSCISQPKACLRSDCAIVMYSYTSAHTHLQHYAHTHHLASPQRLPKVSCSLQAMSRTDGQREGTYYSNTSSRGFRNL